MTLRVLDPGLFTLVVDNGRTHWRHKGVPLGGAADRTSLALGNALVGNPPDAPALECCLHGPTLTTDAPLACVFFGAPFDIEIDGRRVASNTTFTLDAGKTLAIGGTSAGMRAYLCVHGGLRVDSVLGSKSGFIPIRANDSFECSDSTVQGRSYAPRLIDELRTYFDHGDKVLRFVDGPQSDWFDREITSCGLFEVQNDSDRMGLRLLGEPLQYDVREFTSEPVCPGSVQVTRNGQCIILGVDGQTIGGYPKIANVISADLDRLGQLRPKETISFDKVTMAEAVALHRQKMRALRECVCRARATWTLASVGA